ncbi:MAG: radical SAM protein [Janthinobacterium lividum]
MENPAFGHIQQFLSYMPASTDYPEIWALLRENAVNGDPGEMQGLLSLLEELSSVPQDRDIAIRLKLLYQVTRAVCGAPEEALADLERLSVRYTQDVMVSGALFFVRGLLDPDNPKYDLTGKICKGPFERVDVLENSVHQCCASYLPTSMGNLQNGAWQDVWNSPAAQAVRESMLDGSYRYCNKILCPAIQSNTVTTREQLLAKEPHWAPIVDARATEMTAGPAVVNLSYDRTCNLSCPSCRKEKFASSSEMRVRFEGLQNRNILPMLKTARLAHVTGSGDPFASKNFRSLLKSLNREQFPDLKIQLMTNGMLFTPQEWEKFQNLKGMVGVLYVSIDAARGPTHEALRRGAKWETMLENLAFMGRLRAAGEVDHFVLTFVVQQENYREMGEAVDLARAVGADSISFSPISNWGTFTSTKFRQKYIFAESHPEHADFLECMRDPRLNDPIVSALALSDFRPAEPMAA